MIRSDCICNNTRTLGHAPNPLSHPIRDTLQILRLPLGTHKRSFAARVVDVDISLVVTGNVLVLGVVEDSLVAGDVATGAEVVVEVAGGVVTVVASMICVVMVFNVDSCAETLVNESRNANSKFTIYTEFFCCCCCRKFLQMMHGN
jgi:hypothetical protein